MKNLASSCLHASSRALFALILAATCSDIAQATDLTTQRLSGRWAQASPTNYNLGASGQSAGLSSKWYVLGAPGAAERGLLSEGGVQVFDGTTGNWLRKILPPLPATDSLEFGRAIAISGDIAAVGAVGANVYRGKVFIVKLTTGAILSTLTASDGAANDFFGATLAISGNTLFVGAPGYDTNKGAVYLYNLTTYAQLTRLQPADAAINNLFGKSIAVEGNVLAVGAPSADYVYLWDVAASPIALIRKVRPVAAIVGDGVGSSVAMHQGRLAIGAEINSRAFLYDIATLTDMALVPTGPPALTSAYGGSVAIQGAIIAVSDKNVGTGVGAIHLFNSDDGSYIRALTAPNNSLSALQFGAAMAFNGSTLLATAPTDGTNAIAAGAAFLIKPITAALNYAKVAGQGDYAPSTYPTPEINFGKLGDAFINGAGKMIFTTSLSGFGSHNGKDTAAYADYPDLGVLTQLRRSSDQLSPIALYSVISRPAMNDDLFPIGYGTLTGTGVTAQSNLAIWYGTLFNEIIRTGDAVPGFPGGLLLGVPELAASNKFGAKQLAMALTLRVGAGGVTVSSDTGCFVKRYGGMIASASLWEGLVTLAPLPVGSKLGQFAPRMCFYYDKFFYSTALTDTGITPANNAALFAGTIGSSEALVAQKGSAAVDGTGVVLANTFYSAFIGESANGNDSVLYRASLTGSAVTVATNEALWIRPTVGSTIMVLRKGQALTTPAGTKIASIINFWASGAIGDSDQALILVTLSGTGVTAANDKALLLWQADSTLLLLMREGDPAPGCSPAKIGVIAQVQHDAWGKSYALIATLAGAPKGTDLALYTGNAGRGNLAALAPLRRPFLRLRKGQLLDNQPSKIKSIALPTSNLTPSGAGSTGRGQAISYSDDFAFTVEFDNAVRQIVKGKAF